MCITKKGVNYVYTYIHYIEIGKSPELFLVVDIAGTGIGRCVGQCIWILGRNSKPYILIHFFEIKPRHCARFFVLIKLIEKNYMFGYHYKKAKGTP